MNPNWTMERLGDVAVTQYGLSVPMNEAGRGYKIFRMGEVQEGRLIDTGQMKYADIGKGEFEQYKLNHGDVLFNRTNSFQLVGKTGIFKINGDYCFASYLVRLKPDRKKVLPEFLNYLMNSEQFQKSVKDKASRSINQANINATILSNEVIRLPKSIIEQQRIARILDEAFESIATAKANVEKSLRNSGAIFRRSLEGVFSRRGKGWIERQLDQAGMTQTGSTPKTSDAGNYGDFIPFVKPADFKIDGSLDYENEGLSEKGLSGARKVAARSALMVCIGATIGKAGYCDREITTNQQINSFTPFKGVHYKFIYYQMLTEDFQRRIVLGSGQATLPIINKSKWSALRVALPKNIEEQEAIAAELDSLRGETQRLESIYQQKLIALNNLKKSLLHQAFTGKL